MAEPEKEKEPQQEPSVEEKKESEPEEKKEPAPEEKKESAPEEKLEKVDEAKEGEEEQKKEDNEGEEQEEEETEEEEEGEEEEGEEESSEEEAPVEVKEKPISKFVLLHEFIQQTDNFLLQFDELVENSNQHKTLYLTHINPLREKLVALLLRFIQNELPRDDYLYKHIKCCEEAPLNNEEFAEHYEEVHKKDDEGKSLPEISAIDEYFQNCIFYIAEGKVVNVDLLFKLRRLLRKSNTALGGVILDLSDSIKESMN